MIKDGSERDCNRVGLVPTHSAQLCSAGNQVTNNLLCQVCSVLLVSITVGGLLCSCVSRMVRVKTAS